MLYKKIVEKEHRGMAVREYYVTEETDWYSEKRKWKGLKSFVMVHKRLEKQGGNAEKGICCYIGSIKEDADEFERVVCRRRGVENNLYWKIDFTLRMTKIQAW